MGCARIAHFAFAVAQEMSRRPGRSDVWSEGEKTGKPGRFARSRPSHRGRHFTCVASFLRRRRNEKMRILLTREFVAAIFLGSWARKNGTAVLPAVPRRDELARPTRTGTRRVYHPVRLSRLSFAPGVSFS